MAVEFSFVSIGMGGVECRGCSKPLPRDAKERRTWLYDPSDKTWICFECRRAGKGSKTEEKEASPQSEPKKRKKKKQRFSDLDL